MNATIQAIAERYRRLADAFEHKVVSVRPEQWSNPSPCAKWTASDVVDHIVMMHGAMLRPLDRQLGAAPSVVEDPLPRSARHVPMSKPYSTIPSSPAPCATPRRAG